MKCALCQQVILKTRQPPGTVPLMQAVFTRRKGEPIHIPPCPPKERK